MSDFLIRALAESKTPALFVKKHLLPMIDARKFSSKSRDFPYSSGHFQKVVFVNSKGEEMPLVSSRRRQGGEFTLTEKWKAPKIKIGRLSIPNVSDNSKRPFEDWEKSERNSGGATKVGETFFVRVPETAIQHWNPVVEEKAGHLVAKVALEDALFKELKERHDGSDLLHRYLTSLYHVSRLFDNSGEIKAILKTEGIFGLSAERPHFIKSKQQFDFASLNWLAGKKLRGKDLVKRLVSEFRMPESVAVHCSKIFGSLYSRPKAMLSMRLLSNNPEMWGRAFDFPGTVGRMLSSDWFKLKERQEKGTEGVPKIESQESTIKKGAKRVLLKQGDSTPILLGVQKSNDNQTSEERFEFILKANIYIKPAFLQEFKKEFESAEPYKESVSHENKVNILRNEIKKLEVKARKREGEKKDGILALKLKKEEEFSELVSKGPSIFSQNFTNFISRKFSEAFPGCMVSLRKTFPEKKNSTDYVLQVSLGGLEKLKALALVRSLARSKVLYSATGSAAVLSQEEWGNIMIRKGKMKEKLPPSGYQDLRQVLATPSKKSTWVRLYPAVRS